jgi:hypothetical protein
LKYKITIGITTYNRLEYVKKCALSLKKSNNIDNCNIRIFDDNSDEFSIEKLSSVFSNAKEIIRRDNNLGADQNMRQMFCDFLQTGDELLLIADSDLIFNPNWINVINKHFEFTDGILSLYNSSSHQEIDRVEKLNDILLMKNHIGAAGTVFHRNIIADIVKNVSGGKNFDWKWSKFLINKGMKIYVTNQSYIQHIGFIGYNCDGFEKLEFGKNFLPGNSFNLNIILDYYQNIIINQHQNIKSRIDEKAEFKIKNSKEYKLGNLLLSPIKKILKK